MPFWCFLSGVIVPGPKSGTFSVGPVGTEWTVYKFSIEVSISSFSPAVSILERADPVMSNADDDGDRSLKTKAVTGYRTPKGADPIAA